MVNQWASSSIPVYGGTRRRLGDSNQRANEPSIRFQLTHAIDSHQVQQARKFLARGVLPDERRAARGVPGVWRYVVGSMVH